MVNIAKGIARISYQILNKPQKNGKKSIIIEIITRVLPKMVMSFEFFYHLRNPGHPL